MNSLKDKTTYIIHFRSLPEWLKKSPVSFHLLAEFARRARRTEGSTVWHGEVIHLKQRQFITGRISVAKELGISEGQYRTAYRILIEFGFIRTIKTTKRMTICSYIADEIFDINLPTDQPSDRPSKKPSDIHQTTTNNNDNNIQEIWNYYLLCSKTKELLTPARRLKIKTRLNRYTPEQIKEAINKCFDDPFYNGEKNDRGWRANADYVFRNDEIVDRLLNLEVKNQSDWHHMPLAKSSPNLNL